MVLYSLTLTSLARFEQSDGPLLGLFGEQNPDVILLRCTLAKYSERYSTSDSVYLM